MNKESLKPLFDQSVHRIHLIGVGGMGMAPLASYLAQAGYVISGEDDSPRDEVLPVLKRSGVTLGPLPGDCDLVVCSAAIKTDQPSMIQASRHGGVSVKRGEMLAEISKGKKLVAI